MISRGAGGFSDQMVKFPVAMNPASPHYVAI